jgi:hypothetical protein
MDMTLKDQDIRESRSTFWKKLPLDAFLFLTCWIVFLFIPKSWERMPKGSFLRYYEDAKFGINGDPYWVQPNKSGQPSTPEAARTWYWRSMWSVRNANTWDHEHGVFLSDLVRIEFEGEPNVANKPKLVEGDLAIHAWDKNGKRWWAYYSVHILIVASVSTSAGSFKRVCTTSSAPVRLVVMKTRPDQPVISCQAFTR